MPTTDRYALVSGSHFLIAALVAGSLCGCGGSGDAPAPGASAMERDAVKATPAELPPLFDEHGQAFASPAALVPSDASARTRSGLYATRAQYEWQALTLPPYTVLLDVDALGSEQAAVDEAELSRGAPGVAWFVRARQPARAAMVADRLTYFGIAPVFVVR